MPVTATGTRKILTKKYIYPVFGILNYQAIYIRFDCIVFYLIRVSLPKRPYYICVNLQSTCQTIYVTGLLGQSNKSTFYH